jgi:hypothetical protein
MGLFVVLADIVYNLHVLLIVAFEGLAALEVDAEHILQNESDVLAAF